MAGKQHRDEDRIQKAIVQYAMFALKTGHMVFAIPNGGYRLPSEAARLQGLGVKAGVFDLCILGPRGQTWWMEVKTAKGALSPAQVTFKEHCVFHNVPYSVVRSLDDAMEAMQRWGVVR